jgi:tetratricopeptide (TPR) repeat protein
VKKVGLLLLLSLSLISTAHAESDVRTEAEARAIDMNAYYNMKKALTSLGGIVQKSRGTSAEPNYLIRYAGLAQETASIEFRIAYGKVKRGAQADLTEYKSMMKSSLTALDRLIVAYPQSSNLSQAYRLRAHALTESGQVNEAISDLKYYVEHWPRSPDAPVANVDLWTLLINTKSYTDAIHYIKQYGLRTNDRYYNTALEKLAWCNYYLGSIEDALMYTEAEFKTARKTERDKALANMPLFYATGIEKKTPNVTADNAIPRFKRSVSGDELGKVIISLAYLLRSKQLDNDLETIKIAFEKTAVPDTSRAAFLVLVFENEMNREQYGAMKKTAEQEIALYSNSSMLQKSPRSLERLRGSFMSSAPTLQQIFSKQTPSDPALAGTLNTVYAFILKSSKGDVLEQAKIHFNMAEVCNHLQDYEGAVTHFHWVTDHLSFKTKNERDLFVSASHRAIDTRYETLKANNWVPKELTATASSSPRKDVPKQVSEWIDWVDHFPASIYIQEKVDAQAFEANRILYSFNQIDTALTRMTQFLKDYPKSASAVPTASLIIDTYIADQNWAKTFEVASGFLQQSWQTPEFHNHLMDVVGDSYCKILDGFYKDKKYATALQGADDFLAKNPTSKRRADVLILAANASLGTGDRLKALAYFKQLSDSGNKNPEITNLALMTEGSLEEEHFNFEAAAASYRKYIENGGAASADLKSKALLFAWLSGKPAELQATLNSKAICGKNPDPSCATYSGASIKLKLHHLDRALEMVSISGKLSRLKDIEEDWKTESALGRYGLLSKISDVVPQVLVALRKQIKEEFRLKLDKGVIAQRVHWAQEEEKVAVELTNQGWSKVHLIALMQAAGVYKDIVKDLHAIKQPKGLSDDDKKEYGKMIDDAGAPFQAKSDEYQKAAIDYATTSGSDEKTLAMMSKEFEIPYTPQSQKEAYGKNLLTLIKPGPSDMSKDLVREFADAIEKSNWPKAGFLIQWAQTSKDKSLLTPTDISIMKAILLSRTDAVAEATGELSSSLDKMSGSVKDQATRAIASTILPSRAPAAVNASQTPSGSPTKGGSK